MRREDLRTTAGWVGAGLLVLAALAAWQGITRRRPSRSTTPIPGFERAIPFLQCPRCFHSPLSDTVEASALVCPACSAQYPCRSGIIDLTATEGDGLRTTSQRLFPSPGFVALFDRLYTSPLARLVTGYSLQQEAQQLAEHLQVKDGEPILDVTCGSANFTRVLATRLPHSQVFGLDMSWTQLRRARRHLDRAGIRNVLLVRGDVMRLPFRSGVFRQVSTSGGLHQASYLQGAAMEVARVLKPGGHFAGMTLASGSNSRLVRKFLAAWPECNFVDMAMLGSLLRDVGLQSYEYRLSRWIGYFWARKATGVQQ